MNLGIINMKYGNIYSIIKSLKKINRKTKIKIIKNYKDLSNIDKLIFPGNGSILICFSNINNVDLMESIKIFIKKNKFYLGICIGFQIFFNYNKEGKQNCLGIMKGKIVKNLNKKSTHIGWNSVFYKKFIKVFFFSHSFYVKCRKKKITYFTRYGNIFFPSIFEYKNSIITQFHPELSSYNGLKIIEKFIKKK
ncbi:imidazole glycerol phosphate synthase subunit HisH [Candidatus Vidania fulgoroideorum]